MSDCVTNPHSSCVCVLGTKSCVMKHTGIVERDKRITELEEENERLHKKFMSAVTRMDRARHILTDGNQENRLHWMMLDTSDLVDYRRIV